MGGVSGIVVLPGLEGSLGKDFWEGRDGESIGDSAWVYDHCRGVCARSSGRDVERLARGVEDVFVFVVVVVIRVFAVVELDVLESKEGARSPRGERDMETGAEGALGVVAECERREAAEDCDALEERGAVHQLRLRTVAMAMIKLMRPGHGRPWGWVELVVDG